MKLKGIEYMLKRIPALFENLYNNNNAYNGRKTGPDIIDKVFYMDDLNRRK